MDGKNQRPIHSFLLAKGGTNLNSHLIEIVNLTGKGSERAGQSEESVYLKQPNNLSLPRSTVDEFSVACPAIRFSGSSIIKLLLAMNVAESSQRLLFNINISLFGNPPLSKMFQ